MGALLCVLQQFLFSKKEYRIAMVGLDGAGKTTILFKLKIGEVTITNPTIGFNVEVIEYKNINFTIWDVGGQTKLRPLWRYYFNGTHGMIFVIDCNDRHRFNEAREELRNIMTEDGLSNAVFLILANKQDLPNAMSAPDVLEKLDLQDVIGGRKLHVQATCATSSDGLYEGLDWLAREVKAAES